ncbi:protein activator of alkane oxidation PraA [Pseudomonas orientalis]|uniref:alkane oxidation protein activator PraA n=1 Tax=Pseudomonas orientalis TaxID=76758 RepID=UPI000F581BEC|nr:alkane oxidation protein activator PraA [Pseudomonas orientalis]AZE94390.1 protein activator of alkane oxidation PraA [Pseudomonas orientalis]AZE99831.1 protein activator of alkane oxidation PraA [Pseudomonas orientalis]
MQVSAKFTVHVLLVALGLIACQHAQAARIEPAGSAFTAQGPISFSKGTLISADCTIKVAGKVAADGTSVNIDKVAFDGGLKCSRVEAINLPWILIAKDTKSGSMSKISVDVHAFGLGGKCGPSTALGTWDNATGKLEAANVPIGDDCIIKAVSIKMPPDFKVVE